MSKFRTIMVKSSSSVLEVAVADLEFQAQFWNSGHNFGIPGTILEFHHEGFGITKTSGVAGTLQHNNLLLVLL